MATPAAEILIEEGLVRALLEEQHPDLADRSLERVPAGWDNATFRLGRDLAVRLPKRLMSAPLIAHEQRWLPELAPRLPLAVPAPVRVGVPGHGYPWQWSIVPWLDGLSAEFAPPAPGEAPVFGAFLRALHQPAPADAPENQYRGVPLQLRQVAFDERIERLQMVGVDVDVALEAWEWACRARPRSDRVWIHGDLHPRNVLTRRGGLRAVLDWGDITAGDAAADLASAWMLFPPTVHPEFREGYGNDGPDLWIRARGWAAFFAVLLLDAGVIDDPGFEDIGQLTLSRLAATL